MKSSEGRATDIRRNGFGFVGRFALGLRAAVVLVGFGRPICIHDEEFIGNGHGDLDGSHLPLNNSFQSAHRVAVALRWLQPRPICNNALES